MRIEGIRVLGEKDGLLVEFFTDEESSIVLAVKRNEQNTRVRLIKAEPREAIMEGTVQIQEWYVSNFNLLELLKSLGLEKWYDAIVSSEEYEIFEEGQK